MNCCTQTQAQEQPSREQCPSCGTTGILLDAITLRALLNANTLRRGIPAHPRFCAAPACAIVYFAAAVTFAEDDLIVQVHAKHDDADDVQVCYCFGHTPGSMRDELLRTGRSTAFATITSDVRAGRCACEVKNPKGSCCLGEVKKLEQRLTAELSVGADPR